MSTTWRPVAGVEVYLHSFLTSAVDGGEWSTSRPGRFTPLKERWYVSNRRLGMPQSQSRRFGEDKILLPRAESQTSVHRAPSCPIGCCICLVVFNDVRDKQNCTRWRSRRSVVHRYHNFNYFAHVLSWDVFHMLYKAAFSRGVNDARESRWRAHSCCLHAWWKAWAVHTDKRFQYNRNNGRDSCWGLCRSVLCVLCKFST